MKYNNKRMFEIGDWFNNHKMQVTALIIAIFITLLYTSFITRVMNNPQEVSYREFINDMNAGMDIQDDDGKITEVIEDKIDTVYFDLSSEEWRYTLWNEDSRKRYEEWLSSGKPASEFKYKYPISNWKKVYVYSMSYDKMKEHIDKYDGIACRKIVEKNFQPFYAKYIQAFGSLALTFGFLLAFMGIYAKKMSNMGGITKSLLVEDTGVRFDDVIGHKEIIEDLRLIVELMRKSREDKESKEPDKSEKSGNIYSKSVKLDKSKISANIPRGMLFSGEAGTGKTMLAKAIAGEAGVPFLSMNASNFVEMFVGVGARRVRDLFKTARKHSPCIIFIDEIDAVGADRNSTSSSEQTQTINALLQEMDGFDTRAGIFVIAATNNPDTLDKALVRSGRFDRQVIISPPRDYKERMQLFELYLKDDEYNADLELLSKECVGFTGADINAVCNESRLIAIAQNADTITTDMLEEAIDRKIFKGNHVKKNRNDRSEEIEIVSYHEAGHAITSIMLGVKVARATIIGSTGGVGGAVFRADEQSHYVSKKDAVNQVMIACGGRAAEEIVFGKDNITTGAANDIQQVSLVLKEYVCSYGFDENMVALSVLYEQKLYSENVVKRVTELSNEFYHDTLELLSANRDKLDILAKALMEKETMSGSEIYKLLGLDDE